MQNLSYKQKGRGSGEALFDVDKAPGTSTFSSGLARESLQTFWRQNQSLEDLEKGYEWISRRW